MKNLIGVLNLVFILNSMAQNESNNWYFGFQAGLNFSTNPPTILYNSAISAPESGASISDVNGNLLFYTNGASIWNSAHSIMANGNGLLGSTSSTEEALIVKQPGTQDIYYIFTQDEQGHNNGFRYSIVDMSLAAGMGSVTIKNTLIHTPSCEKIAGVKHCNGKDVWIISHDFNSNQFRVYLLTSAGLSTSPIITSIGTNITTPRAAVGHLKVSPNGRKLASTIGDTSQIGGFELFDFDNANGVITNSLVLRSYGIHYGCEFSPDSRLFYGTNVSWDNNNSSITQWDLCAGSSAAVVSSSFAVSTGTNRVYSMQLANNNKIYINHSYSSNPYLSVINNPNGIGASMAFSIAAQSIAPNASLFGLVNFVTNSPPTLITFQPFTFSTTCSNVSFIPPSEPTVAIICSTVTIHLNSYNWDFGDPSSGASNTSTLSNPQHLYSSLGTYSTSLIVQSACSTDTLYQTITVTALTPTFSVSGPSVICTGEKAVFTASGASNYTWTNIPSATNVNSVMVNPTLSTQYSVSVTNPTTNCSYSQSFQLTVNKCTAIESENAFSEKFMVYPIPAKEKVTIELKDAIQNWMELEIEISNQLGQIVFKKKMEKSFLEMDLSDWQNGIYLIHLKSIENRAYKKLIVGY